MAWTLNIVSVPSGTHTYYEETLTLPSSATTGFSSEINFVTPRREFTDAVVLLEAQATTVSGTNVDIQLHKADTSGGTKTLLLDAVVADLTSAAPTAGASLDLNTYVGGVYYLRHETDQDESANSITYRIRVS